MSLFNNTSRLAGEDVSTEILACFLNSGTSHIPFQMLFNQRLYNKPDHFIKSDVEIITRADFKNGRPDMPIASTGHLFLIENKLGSTLSGSDQLVKYVEIFDDDRSVKNTLNYIDYDSSLHRTFLPLPT